MSGLRTYECEHYSLSAPERSCFFRQHCTDIWFDYTNGPYMFWCDLEANVESGLKGECARFEEGYDG